MAGVSSARRSARATARLGTDLLAIVAALGADVFADYDLGDEWCVERVRSRLVVRLGLLGGAPALAAAVAELVCVGFQIERSQTWREAFAAELLVATTAGKRAA